MARWDSNTVLGVIDDNKCIGHSVRDGSQKCRRPLSARKASLKHEAIVLLCDAPLDSITLEQLKSLAAAGLCHSHKQQARGLAYELRGKIMVYTLSWDVMDDEDSDTSDDEAATRDHDEDNVRMPGAQYVLQPSSHPPSPGSWPSIPLLPSRPQPSLRSQVTPLPQTITAGDIPGSQRSTWRASRRRLNGEDRFTPYGSGPCLNSDRPTLSLNLNKRLFRNSKQRSRQSPSVQRGPRVDSRSALDVDASPNEHPFQHSESAIVTSPELDENRDPGIPMNSIELNGPIQGAQSLPQTAPATRSLIEDAGASAQSTAIARDVLEHSTSNQSAFSLAQNLREVISKADRVRRYQEKARQSRKDLRVFLIAGNKLKGSCADHVMRRPYVGEQCGICKEEMDGSNPGALMWCVDGCGQSFHARPECLTAWLQVSMTCPHCRIPWSSKVCACDPWIREVLMTQV